MPEAQHSQTTTTTTTDSTSSPQVETTHEERGSSMFSDILTIIGFAILFIIIIWGLVHLVELVTSSFTSNKHSPTIQVNAPAQATSGQAMQISWNYTPGTAGSYAFLYECETGLSFKMQVATSSQVAIPCGTAYTTPTSASNASAANSLTLTPILSTASSTTDTISIVFIPSQTSESASQVQGNAMTTVNPAAKPVPAATTAPKKTTSASYSNYGGSYGNSWTNYNGPAQLSVRVVSGSINGNGDGTVTFDIANVGGQTSGSYTFSAQLPTAEPYPYQSPLQAPLAPGSHITSTLNFTDAASGGGLFTVTISGASAYGSSDYASMQLTGPYNNYNYNNSEPYLQYPNPTYTY